MSSSGIGASVVMPAANAMPPDNTTEQQQQQQQHPQHRERIQNRSSLLTPVVGYCVVLLLSRAVK